MKNLTINPTQFYLWMECIIT